LGQNVRLISKLFIVVGDAIALEISMYRMFTVQAYQTSQYVGPRVAFFLGK
jgi:hypothetical protein